MCSGRSEEQPRAALQKKTRGSRPQGSTTKNKQAGQMAIAGKTAAAGHSALARASKSDSDCKTVAHCHQFLTLWCQYVTIEVNECRSFFNEVLIHGRNNNRRSARVTNGLPNYHLAGLTTCPNIDGLN